MSRRRHDRGATAVIVAVLAVLVFSVAALAVDLGNAWARKRAVQKQADISALSAGYRLPQTPANKAEIAAEVATYLNQNLAAGQPTVTGPELIDTVTDNGEVTFFDDAGDACTTLCTQMRVLPPEAVVDFGLAGVMGFSGTTVQRAATVRVQSALPPKEKMIPLWLPSGCGLGSAQSDTVQGNDAVPGPAPSASARAKPSATATATATGATASPSETVAPTVSPEGVQGSHVLSGPSPVTVAQGGTVQVSGWVVSGVPPKTDRGSLRFYSPDGSRYIEYAASFHRPKSTIYLPPFPVGREVSDTPGDWRVYAMVLSEDRKAQVKYSRTSLVIRVAGAAAPTQPATSASASPTSVPVNCVGQDRGNFGQLDSPRKTGGTLQTRLALNMAAGLDHQLVPFVFAPSVPVSKTCGKEGSAIEGAQLDNVALDGRNCIAGNTGNDGPALYDGLISGVSGVPGRLDVSRGVTDCPADPARVDTSVGGVTINNDLLSCFLRNGASLADLTETSGVEPSMLDPAIVESPRFVWLPVVYATDRAQTEFQPILDFAPAFITDETTTSAATAANGVGVAGTSVTSLQVFVFNKAALPIDEQSPTVDYDTTLQQSIVRLVG